MHGVTKFSLLSHSKLTVFLPISKHILESVHPNPLFKDTNFDGGKVWSKNSPNK